MSSLAVVAAVHLLGPPTPRIKLMVDLGRQLLFHRSSLLHHHWRLNDELFCHLSLNLLTMSPDSHNNNNDDIR